MYQNGSSKKSLESYINWEHIELQIQRAEQNNSLWGFQCIIQLLGTLNQELKTISLVCGIFTNWLQKMYLQTLFTS